jgi:hypothetical protein
LAGTSRRMAGWMYSELGEPAGRRGARTSRRMAGWMYSELEEPAGRRAEGESPDQEMAKSLECENRATRPLQMEVSMDNRYGAIEAGG